MELIANTFFVALPLVVGPRTVASASTAAYLHVSKPATVGWIDAATNVGRVFQQHVDHTRPSVDSSCEHWRDRATASIVGSCLVSQ